MPPDQQLRGVAVKRALASLRASGVESLKSHGEQHHGIHEHYAGKARPDWDPDAQSAREAQRDDTHAHREMGEAMGEIEKDRDIKVVVIRGAGRAFCTGYDLTVGLSDGSGQRYTLDDDQHSLQRYVEHWL